MIIMFIREMSFFKLFKKYHPFYVERRVPAKSPTNSTSLTSSTGLSKLKNPVTIKIFSTTAPSKEKSSFGLLKNLGMKMYNFG